MKKVVVITGPTGVGKTSLSIKLAQIFGAEIINADASQFRRGLNVGTAKITIDEMQGVKHHLINILAPEDSFSIKDYQAMGRELIIKIDKPFIVGGSGLYIQALITNYELEDTPERDEEKFSQYSNEELHKLLQSLDYEASIKIHPNNRRRVIRYLEIAQTKGLVTPVQRDYLYDALVICLTRPREILYQRINERFDVMIANGWVDECRELINQGVNLANVKDIGYAEINSYLNGAIPFEDIKELIKQKTRHYAKRQMTWFRNKMDCHFIDLENDNTGYIINLISNFYKNA